MLCARYVCVCAHARVKTDWCKYEYMSIALHLQKPKDKLSHEQYSDLRGDTHVKSTL